MKFFTVMLDFVWEQESFFEPTAFSLSTPLAES